MTSVDLPEHGQIAVSIKRLSRSSSIRIRLAVGVEGPQIKVTAPKHVRDFQVEAFIKENTDWILKQLASGHHSAGLKIESGARIAILGVEWKLLLQGRTNPEVKIFLDERDDREKTIHIFHPENSTEADLKAALQQKLKTLAKSLIQSQTLDLAKQFGFEYGRIKIAEQSSRWGSCSSRGNLNFNWKLILAPAEVCRYVIVHELAHLRQQNHSQAFWDLVEQMDPRYRAHRIWLKRNGHSLKV